MANSASYDDAIHQEVRRHYGEIAGRSAERTLDASCGCDGSSCCSPAAEAQEGEQSRDRNDYSGEELGSDAAEGNLGLGCGNPVALASLVPGQTVLDLGSGAGFDCFLAARRVGDSGRVIGVDMTAEMVSRARRIARERDFRNVEFRLGEIEHLPVADASIDVVMSNCVINLSPRKEEIFREAFRVLKDGGRLAIADVIATAPIPTTLRDDTSLYVGCLSGAVEEAVLLDILTDQGFVDIRVEYRSSARIEVASRDDAAPVAAAYIAARKPH